MIDPILIPELIEILSPNLTPARRNLIEEVLAMRTRHFTVVIEDVFQDHNAGAIVRTCDCMGLQDVHIIESYNTFRPSERISKGALKWVDSYFYTEQEGGTIQCIQSLKEQGYQIIATSPHENDCSTDDFDIAQKSAFFLGAEKKGVSNTVLKNADGFVKIPMYGFTESYNVSVACALLLQTLTQKMRKHPSLQWKLNKEAYEAKKLEWITKSIPNGEKMMQYYLTQLIQNQKNP